MSQKRVQWRTLALISVALPVALLAGPSSVGNVTYTASTASTPTTDLLSWQLLPAAITLKTRLVFSVSPQHAGPHAPELYRPITEYLSRVTGKAVVYKEPGDWRGYLRGMQKGEYDLVFDSAHFAGWRIARAAHDPLVRLTGRYTFVVVVRNDNPGIDELVDLAGRRVCGPKAPHEGGLILQSQFDNPARQPLFVESNNWSDSYQALIDGTCDSAILPLHVYEQVDPKGDSARVLFKGVAMPHHTLTAGPRVSAHDRATITRALLSPEGHVVTKAIRDRFRAEGMISAAKVEYEGLDKLLRNTWGFDG